MLQKQSFLKVADNSGALLLQIIHIHGSTRKRYASLGDRVKVTVKKAIADGMVKKSEVLDALIVRTAKEYRRADGSYVRFGDNAAVILKDNQPVGTRVFGPVAREVRAEYPEVASRALEVV